MKFIDLVAALVEPWIVLRSRDGGWSVSLRMRDGSTAGAWKDRTGAGVGAAGAYIERCRKPNDVDIVAAGFAGCRVEFRDERKHSSIVWLPGDRERGVTVSLGHSGRGQPLWAAPDVERCIGNLSLRVVLEETQESARDRWQAEHDAQREAQKAAA